MEWEYACRADSKTAYFFGDESKIGEYSWYRKNSDAAYKKVETKKPHAWGLYDMHGNVMEWPLDRYIPDCYTKQLKGETFAPVTELYPTSVRGGSRDDEAANRRSAARTASKPEWKILYPQLPKSEWWMTSASFVGFPIVRPLKTPLRKRRSMPITALN